MHHGFYKGRRDEEEEKFQLSKVLTVFTSLPRVISLVWSTSALLTSSMGIISVLRGILPLATALVTKLLIDSVVEGIKLQSFGLIWLPVILQLVLLLFDRLLSTVSNITQQLLQEQVSNRIQLMVLEKANTLDLQFFEDSEFYDKLRRASSDATFRPVQMISQSFDLVRTVITLVTMLGLLLRLAWWLALIALVVPIPAFIANTRYGWIGYRRMRHQSPDRRKMAYFQQVMTVDNYNKEIKLFNLGDYFIERFRFLAVKVYKEGRALVVKRYLMGFLWGGLSIAANSGIYLYVAWQTVMRQISLGDLTMYTQAATQVGSSFQNFLDGISSLYENNLFVNNLFEFLQYEPRIASPSQATAVKMNGTSSGLDIEFRNVSFTYPGKQQAALKNVSFTIRVGEAIALVGRNGAGKTTLVKLLTRLYDPDEGEILIGGRNVKEYELTDLRRHVGVIFQDYVNYQMNARENIGVGLIDEIENREMVTKAARKSGANAVIERLDDGYETMLGKWFDDGAQLSGGEWQKIALARAFMRDASVLVLDEPTSALDAQAEYEVFTHFRTLTEGKTAIFISHRFSTVRLADRIFVIEHGGVLESGSHAELMALDGRYAELFNLQAEAYR
jgi:ATP-binding cassette subfamily B protein